MNDIQTMRQAMDQNIDIPARVAVRNGRGEVLPALTSDFTVSVTGNGSGAACLDATITKRDGAKGTTVAVPDPVDGQVEFTHFNVIQTLNVDGDTEGCEPVYMLFVKDTQAAVAYKPLEEFVEELRLEVAPAELTSEIHFDEHTGDVDVRLSNTDVDNLRARFTAAGVTSIDF
jgi:hypothetical protein